MSHLKNKAATTKAKGFIYGPVASRRLGFSLGLDLVPYKICSYDCIYCQLGRTTIHTTSREKYLDLTQLMIELIERLQQDNKIDYITLAGSGEPTLNSQLGEIIKRIKVITDIPLAVLTNGSLLFQREVQQDLMAADLVLPSLDAVSAAVFQKVNRPTTDLDINQVLTGLVEFSSQYPGKIHLEVMLVAGMNDTGEELGLMREFIQRMKPDRVQLNTVVRPPAGGKCAPLTPERLLWAKEQLHGEIPVEIVANFRRAGSHPSIINLQHAICELLRRRPCPVSEMATVLGRHQNEVLKELAQLMQKGVVKKLANTSQETNFYTINRSQPS